MQDNKTKVEKSAYHAPRLTTYGKLRELTLGNITFMVIMDNNINPVYKYS